MSEERSISVLDLILDTFILSVIWFLATIFTLGIGIGPATSAVYKVLFRTMRYEKSPDSLFEQFKEDFKSTLPNSIFMPLILLVLLGGALYLTTRTEDISLLIPLYVVAFESLIVLLYVFPALAVFKFENMKHAFKTTLLMANFHALTTFPALGLLVALVAAVYFVPYIWIVPLVAYFILSAKVFHKRFMVYVRRIERADAEEERQALEEKETQEEPKDRDTNSTE